MSIVAQEAYVKEQGFKNVADFETQYSAQQDKLSRYDNLSKKIRNQTALTFLAKAGKSILSTAYIAGSAAAIGFLDFQKTNKFFYNHIGSVVVKFAKYLPEKMLRPAEHALQLTGIGCAAAVKYVIPTYLIYRGLRNIANVYQNRNVGWPQNLKAARGFVGDRKTIATELERMNKINAERLRLAAPVKKPAAKS